MISDELSLYSLVLIGGRKDFETSHFVASDWKGEVINLCGKLTVRETAAIFEGASVYVGPNSGPMHLAASVGLPCVAVESARNFPGIWFPFGKNHRVHYKAVDCLGCMLETCEVEKTKCLKMITAEEVANSISYILSNRSQS